MRCPRCNNSGLSIDAQCDCRPVGGRSRTVATKRVPTRGFVILRRIVICVFTVFGTLGIFYFSLIFTADPLKPEQVDQIERAITVIEKSGFTAEAFYLRNFAAFRGSDNWLNASIAKEGAYAATNFPFAIITVYPDFFTYTADDTERAAILLHEVKHIEGADERDAYAFVWKHKKELGWTHENYGNSVPWKEIRNQTREYAPYLFVCEFNELGDCTE